MAIRQLQAVVRPWRSVRYLARGRGYKQLAAPQLKYVENEPDRPANQIDEFEQQREDHFSQQRVHGMAKPLDHEGIQPYN
jgi:hypothetical protein